MSYDDDYEDDDDREPFCSPPRLHYDPGNASAIELGKLADGSPIIRIGNDLGIALDFDRQDIAVPEEAIGSIRTQRGIHLLFPPTHVGRAAATRAAFLGADPSHQKASESCGSWDLRVTDKGTMAPRTLRREGQACVAGTQEARFFEAVAKVWVEGGGLTQDKAVE
jgi:hypothetical protein